MPNLIAALLIVGLLSERAFAEWTHAKERRYLVNAAIADTPAELKVLDAPRRMPKPKKEPIDGFAGQIGI